MNEVVVDASLAVAWIVPESHTSAARQLLLNWVQRHTLRLVPCLFAPEAGTALLRHLQRGTLRPGSVHELLGELLNSVYVVPEDHCLALRATAIATQLGLAKIYDSLYLALAEKEDCEFWTGDRRFAQAARPTFPRVHWVGESVP
jgi:predicted nucleic acid-binding protein